MWIISAAQRNVSEFKDQPQKRHPQFHCLQRPHVALQPSDSALLRDSLIVSLLQRKQSSRSQRLPVAHNMPCVALDLADCELSP